MTRDNNNKLRAVFLAALMFLWLFAGTVAFAGGAAAQDATLNVADGDFDQAEFFQGQEIRLTGLDTAGATVGEDVQLRQVTGTDGDGNPSSFQTRATREVQAADDGSVTIRTSNIPEGEFVLRETVNNDLLSDSDATPANEFDLRPGDDNIAVATHGVQSINVEFDEEEVRAGDSVELEFDSPERPGAYDVNVSADDVDIEELNETFFDLETAGVVESVDDTTFEDDDVLVLENPDNFFEQDVNISSEIDPGDYDFLFDVQDTTAEDTASLTILEELDVDADFDAAQFTENRGDFVEINVTTEGFDAGETAVVTVGDLDDDGYQANISVEPDDDGNISLLFNTYLAGADASAPRENPFRAAGNVAGDETTTESDVDNLVIFQEGSFEAFSENADDGDLENVLDTGLYDTSVLSGVTDTSDIDLDDENIDELDVATVNIEERSTNSHNVWTAPNNADIGDIEDGDDIIEFVEAGNITQSDTIAIADRTPRRGDYVIHEVGVTGVSGALPEDPDDAVEQLVDSSEFHLNYTQTNPSTNRAPWTLDKTEMGLSGSIADNITLVNDAERDTVYLIVDSDDLAFERGSTGGQGAGAPVDGEFDVEWNATSSYLADFTRDDLESPDDDEVVEDDFEFVDRELDFDTIDDNVTVPASADAEITGDTTVAPGTEITVRTRATGDNAFLREDSDVVVDADREFVGEFDFSDREAGQEFTASVRRQSFDDNAETDGVFGELEGPVFTVSDLDPQDAEVDQGDLIDVSATITNEGDEDGTQTVSLTLDGDELDSQEVELDEGDDTVVEFTDVDTSELEGTYEHGIATDDDSATGTLVVNVDEPDTDDEEPPETDDEEPPETDDEEPPTDDDEPEPEDQVGFGAVVALVALLAAALLAARRNALN